MLSYMHNAFLLLRYLNCKDIWNLKSWNILSVFLEDNTAHTWGSLPKGTKEAGTLSRGLTSQLNIKLMNSLSSAVTAIHGKLNF